jgi:hypothetical protein
LWVDLLEAQTMDPPHHIWQALRLINNTHDILLTNFSNKNAVADPRCGGHAVLLVLLLLRLLSLLVCWRALLLSFLEVQMIFCQPLVATHHNNLQLFWFLHVFDMFLYLNLHVGLNGFFNWVLPSLPNLFVVVMEQTHTMGNSSSSK